MSNNNNKKEESANKAQVTPPPPNNNDKATKARKVTTRYLEIKNFKNIGLEQNVSIEDLDSFDLDNKPKQKSELKAFKLFLNNTFTDKLGGLVLIIGENNTGKSNLLKALGCFSDQLDEFKKNCTPNYVGYEESISSLKLSTLGDKELQKEIAISIDSSSKITFDQSVTEIDLLKTICHKALDNATLSEEDRLSYQESIEKYRIKEDFLNLYNQIISSAPNIQDELLSNIQDELFSQTISDMRDLCVALWRNVPSFKRDFCDNSSEFKSAWLDEVIHNLTTKKTLKGKSEVLENFKKELFPFARMWCDNDRYSRYLSNSGLDHITIWRLVNDETFLKIDSNKLIGSLKKLEKERLEQVPTKQTYTSVEDLLKSGSIDVSKLPNFPQVIYYNNSNRFRHRDLIIKPEELEKSVFFRAFFKAIGVNLSSVKQSYSRASGNIGYLTHLQEQIQQKIISKITNRFNNLYFQKEQNKKWSYLFDFRLDLYNISLSLFKKGANNQKEVLDLDYQSDGFKWFFNLFFSLLFGNSLKRDALILMDEMGSNLSVPTRKECRKFLKEFGQKVGVTFVLVTHDPFLVDMNHLDEVRVLRYNEKSLQSVSVHGFSSVDLGDNGALKTIKKSLGVSHKVLNENDKLLFVEGISDYNYLSAFKLLYEQENKDPLNMVFLPINGLGSDNLKNPDKPKMKEILKTLIEEEPNATLLVDNDKRGQACEELNKELGNKLNLFKLNQCDDSFKDFKNIENLFSENDAIKLDLKNKYSVSHTAYTSALKNDLLLNPSLVETETKGNFYKLLEWLYLKMDADNKVDNKKA
ncbi:AAA family ATPase [Helicobacter pylori]|uniref:AAA family ATPase n=1 Tax=Helicobacter pylori TaxID=210 RepID=UPI001F3192B7|nr:AAA family ATPase [Helicobacter pylori]